MTERYSNARPRRTRSTATKTADQDLVLAEKSCPFSSAQKAIDWLSVVDEFKIKNHKNKLPRWSFLILVLAVLAL
ncbi:MAG: hypothetical protein WCO47_06495 [Methylococcus sp.]|jgi:hypothetical protein